MKRICLVLLAFLTITAGYAQRVKIEFFTPRIVHIVKSQNDGYAGQKSLVVTAEKEDVAFQKRGGAVSSSELTVKLDERTGCVTFLTSKGKVLLREKSHSLEPLTSGNNAGKFKVRQTFTLDKDEAIYGLGTIQNGKMNRRGEHKRMEQSNLEDFQNVLQSIKGWGIYWENYSPTMFDDDAAGMSFTSEVGEAVDYYFMYGGSADGVIAQMRHLSGDVPMFPLWTYGYWQSKERYESADRRLAESAYQTSGIPGTLRPYRQSSDPASECRQKASQTEGIPVGDAQFAPADRLTRCFLSVE